jgi:CRP-like cAMP-binding protein
MSPTNYEELAKRVPLFHGLSPEDVAKIIAKGMTMEVKKGDAVFYQGTVGSQMYVVLGGSVNLTDGKKNLATLRAGDMFGEMALINNEPRSATATAAEDGRLFVLSETIFQKLMTKRVAIRILLNIIATMSKRLRDMNAKLAQATGE